MSEKKCIKCGETKPLNAFPKDKSSKDGYRNVCKECRKKNTKSSKEKKRKRSSEEKEPTAEQPVVAGTTETTSTEPAPTPNVPSEKSLEPPIKKQLTEESKDQQIEDAITNVEIIKQELTVEKLLQLWDKKQNYSMTLLAPRRMGKTEFIKNVLMPMLATYLEYDRILFFSETRAADVYEFLKSSQMQKKVRVFKGYNKKVIHSIINLNNQTENAFKFCLLFDDSLGRFMFTEDFMKLFCIGRNNNFSIIISIQTAEFYYTTLRDNTDFLILLGFHTQDRSDNTYDHMVRGTIRVPPEHRNSIKKERDYFWEFLLSNCSDESCPYRKIFIDFTHKDPRRTNKNVYFIPPSMHVDKKIKQKKETKESEPINVNSVSSKEEIKK